MLRNLLRSGSSAGVGKPADLVIHQHDPSLARPVSQACTAQQMREPAYAHWCSRIGEVPRMHRKQWEFCYIAQVLATCGMLAPGRRGLGFGVGQEPLVSLFASMGCDVVATDQAPDQARRSGWVATAQHAANKEALNARRICPPDMFERLVEFRYVDMTAIPEDLGTFDFTWSACAFEHLGSIEAGKAFIAASARLLAPGGVGVHTTEFNCSSNDKTLSCGSTVLFRQRDFEDMAGQLRAEGFEVELNFELGDDPLDLHVDLPPYQPDNHLKLKIQKWVTTSFGLVLRKPL